MAFRGAQQADHVPHEGRFAAAGAAQDDEHLACVDLERHVFEDRAAAVTLRHVDGLDEAGL